MADLAPVIETMESRWMRAWVRGDTKELKALTARSFILLTASQPPVILDHKSWLEAAAKRWLCTGFTFGDFYVREVAGLALFAGQVELKARMDGADWSGRYWVTDLWTRGRIRRGWRLAQRVISRADDQPDVPVAIRSLQLWKPGKRPQPAG